MGYVAYSCFLFWAYVFWPWRFPSTRKGLRVQARKACFTAERQSDLEQGTVEYDARNGLENAIREILEDGSDTEKQMEERKRMAKVRIEFLGLD